MKFYTEQHQFYCSIDLDANAMCVCLLDAAGEMVVQQNIPTKPKTLSATDQTLPHRLGSRLRMHVYLVPAGRPLATEGTDFVLVHALSLLAIHDSKAKNDKIDFHKIAVLLRGGSFILA